MTPSEHARQKQAELKSLLDRELPLWRRAALAAHLTRCEPCREEMRAMQEVGRELRARKIEPLDAGVRERILASVQALGPASPPVSRRIPARGRTLTWGAAAAALLLLAVFAPHKWQFGRNSYRDEAASPPGAEPAAPSMEAKAMNRGAAAVAAPAAKPSIGNASAAGKVIGSAAAESAPAGRPGLAKRLTNGYTWADGHSRKQKAQPPPETSARDSAGSMAAMKGSSLPGPRTGAELAAPERPGGRTEDQEYLQHRPTGSLTPLRRAGFDTRGYRFVTAGGSVVTVSFHSSLDVVRFARATNGRMSLLRSRSTPVLYLSPSDTLCFAPVPGARWQPLPRETVAFEPLFLRPTVDWDHFAAMRWYPNMLVVGGYGSADPAHAEIAALPGTRVQVGARSFPNFEAYLAYAALHPVSRRVASAHPEAAPSTPARKSPVTPNSRNRR